jgi:hypothetical protein
MKNANKKIAVMQPYFFPYIGYYQLVYSVDEFVFLDDVNLTRKGFINRNYILLNGQPFRFALSISHPSQHRKIKDHRYLGDFGQFLKQITYAYKKAPYFPQVRALIEEVIDCGSDMVSALNRKSVDAVFAYLQVPARFSDSSALEVGTDLRGQDRILEICRCKSASYYHNAIGGQALYQKEAFDRRGVQLRFLRSLCSDPGHMQFSMIDTLMWHSPSTVKRMLVDFHLD